MYFNGLSCHFRTRLNSFLANSTRADLNDSEDMSNRPRKTGPAASSRARSLRQLTLEYLKNIEYASSPFIMTFLLVHLSAPALAIVGGSSLSSQTMIFGREYYQTSFGEKYLVLGPIVVHCVTGVARRFISQREPRPLKSLLSITGYIAMFLFPVHFLTHRYYPTMPDGPVHGVGPAELDFEFVKVALKRHPWVTWSLYTGLLLSTVIHMADGNHLLWNAWFKKARSSRTRKQKIVQNVLFFVVPTLVGLYFLADEPILALSSTVRRFEGALQQSYLYQLPFMGNHQYHWKLSDARVCYDT